MTTLTAQSTFRVDTATRSPGYTLPQRVGRLLWLPMLLMALGLFGAGMAIGTVRAGRIANTGAADTIAALQHLQAGIMFLGFATVLSAVAFAIARILGQFRSGGGGVQEAAQRAVQTLRLPLTGKLFLALMMAATATLVVASVLHLVFAADVESSGASLAASEERFVVLEGVRRLGVAIYLFAILLGLATIVRVLRFQAARIRQLPGEEPRAG